MLVTALSRVQGMFSFLGGMLVIQHINLFYYKEQKVQGAEQATIFDAYNAEWKPDMEVIPQCNIYSGTYRSTSDAILQTKPAQCYLSAADV